MYNFFLIRSLKFKVLCIIYKFLDRKYSFNKLFINKDNNCEYMYYLIYCGVRFDYFWIKCW